MSFLENSAGSLRDQQKVRNRRSVGSGIGSNVVKIIKTINDRQLLPCIVFSFSRKECEAYANEIKNLDFNTGES